MKRKNATRNALFTSIIALLMCVSMLVGTTFAWFTDEVKSGNNVIAAGNLDIELYNDGNKVTANTKLFDGIVWEPGVVGYENFTIKNEGTLALLYDFAINWGDYNTLEGHNLTEILKVAMVDGHVSGDRASAIAAGEEAVWKALSDWSFSGEMTQKGETKDFALIIYWQPSDNDNNYNVQNGKETSDSKALYVNLGINLQATQKMYEEDSFGKDYDALANKWDGSIGEVPAADENNVITITTGAELAAFADAVNNGKNTFSGKTVKLGADINLDGHPWTPIGQTGATQFAGSFDGNGKTIYNLYVDNSGLTTEYGCAGLFGWVEQHSGSNSIKDLTIDGVVINSHRYSGAVAGWVNIPVTNCTVKNVTINCSYYNDDTDGTKVGALVGFADNKSALTGNTVDTATLIAYGDVGGLAGVAQTTVSVDGNTVKNVAITYTSNAKSQPGEIASTRVTPVYGTNTTQNVTINRVIIASSVQMLNAELAKLSGDALSTAAILQNCNEPDGVVNLPADYTGVLTIKDSTIKSVYAAGNANIFIEGDVVVNAKGSGVATAAETETTFNGSAITANGELHISGNGNLTAIAADVEHAAGIGGEKTTKITIENVHIVDVKGGFAQSKITSNWGKSDPKGGAAIGSGYCGAVITLNHVTIDNAEGGSKAAGIGGRYWTGVTIYINNSTIHKVIGGSSSAGIGGSRVTSGATSNENVTIHIVGSTITAVGGDYGAGIGSGYSTYLKPESSERPVYTINIDETSVISATGGVAAAGIGTGHNVVGLVGEIKSQYVTATAGQGICPAPGYDCCYNRSRTYAQDIGLGSLADEIIEKPVTKNITYLGKTVEIPAASAVASSADDLVAALEAGKNVILLNNVKIDPANMSNAYGTTGINVKNGQTIDGNGNTLDIKGAGGTWDSGINTTGGLIKNITVTGSFRGIFINHNSTYSEKVVLENVIIDGTVYTISCDQGTNSGFKATKSTFKGWTSYAETLGAAEFIECDFGEGSGYAYLRAYAPTTFVGCDFEAGFEMDPRAAVTFENCTIGGVALTAENLSTLVTSNIANASVK